MIRSLDDFVAFRRERESAWNGNLEYWLSAPLRHVDDVGDYIVDRVCELSLHRDTKPIILDMGFGSAWLLKEIVKKKLHCSYMGVDVTQAFVARAANAYEQITEAKFILADVEGDLDLGFKADVIVNAFNFFEVCDLPTAMANASKHLKSGGTLLMSTIDKTYLILALSRDWDDFHQNLRLYQELPGIKYDFQHIDLGNGVSGTLKYPSILYSAQDYIDAAKMNGMRLVNYAEQVFTARFVPKIYLHLEFQRDTEA